MASAYFAQNGTRVSFLVLLLALACFTAVHGAYKCNNSKFRKDCGEFKAASLESHPCLWTGYVGITEKQCQDKGCCWDPKDGVAWCFVKNGGYEYCSPTVARVDCGEFMLPVTYEVCNGCVGYFGITKAECLRRGCCYDETPNTAWCFFPNSNIDPKTCPYDDRTDCGKTPWKLAWSLLVSLLPSGYVGIKQDECEGRGCCWSPKEGDKWCFLTKKKAST